MAWPYGCGECLYCQTLRREVRRGRALVTSRVEFPRLALGIRGELRAPIVPCGVSARAFARRRAAYLGRDLED